jgi:hypothetical protein
MRRKSLWVLLLVVATLLGGATSALAASPTPAGAETLYNDTPIGFSLVGNRGGSFAYFTVNYPGDENVVSVELSVYPGDPAAMKGVSLKLYNKNGAQLGNAVPISSGIAVLYGDSVQGVWTVQVANYMDGVTLNFSIRAIGLPSQPAPAAPVAPAKPAAPAAPAVTPAQTATPSAMAGTLAGNSGGAFARYTLKGDGSTMALTGAFNPDTPASKNAIGYTVYGPTGASWKATTTMTPGERVVSFPTDAGSAYEVVVYNYVDGFTVNYSITK